MSPPLLPLRLLILMFAGGFNRRQLDVTEYLQEENCLLKEQLGATRIHFTDVERRRLTRKARAIGRMALNELETLLLSQSINWTENHLAGQAEFVAFSYSTGLRYRIDTDDIHLTGDRCGSLHLHRPGLAPYAHCRNYWHPTKGTPPSLKERQNWRNVCLFQGTDLAQ